MSQRFTRVSEHVRSAVFFAQEEAGRHETRVVTPLHLLLGLIGTKDSELVSIFDSLKLESNAIIAAIDSVIPKGLGEKGDMILSDQSKHAIDQAYEEARSMDSGSLEAKHLFLGVIRDEQSVAAQALAKLGISYDKVKELIQANGRD